ncbi:3-deoxy-D-manno-octulosonic acid transferase [Aquaticitalea lipolytica]|uniref:3-deoxy-D-manno-octulosonic acid transferase n=1 Tax=Aquaticitalea lipolytica TaxID=1247562 RepID=A0A8J2XI27_9FLAO|nr:glycosyltransferase N-terminal domain-containing protein [Aquaticitalea lipolytica]GFZ92513.1 3-deoxy-D-manno-octulosonic acid transferase [Aquaticitalea lipolytica]
MKLIYNIGVYIADFHLKIIALFSHKLKLGVDGRAQTFNILETSISKNDKTFWFHCASLGEYEQGLPVFKVLREKYPLHKIVLTFFSPSGYEIRKNTDVADIVVYLPMDTKVNAKRFLNIVHPELTIFVKYDIWPNYLIELKKRNLRAILISALFRNNQSYFKPLGSMMRNALSAFEHIFVQNEDSKKLLESINFNNVTVAGDTRFDRVSNQLKIDNKLTFIEEFKQDKLCVVVGSSWPEDEELLVNYINSNDSKEIKYIIAPHNIKQNQIQNLTSKLNVKTVLFTEKESQNLSDYSVFIIDTIGILSKIYSYADIAYVGGAMGTTGLHNILEPAVFGVPIIIGKNHSKFPEAQQMIDFGGLKSIKNEDELNSELTSIIENASKRNQMGSLNKAFIDLNKGAIQKITNYLK